MLNRFLRDVSIGHKLSYMIFLSVLLILSVFTFATSYEIQQIVQNKAREDVKVLLNSINDNFEVYDKAVRSDADRVGRYLRVQTANKLSIDYDKKTDVNGKTVSTLSMDGEALNMNFRFVDTFTANTAAVATFFVKEGTDYIRVSTSLKNENGGRAVGTALDKAHPAFTLLNDGKEYIGSAKLFGRPYMTYYSPVADKTGKIFAVIFIGIDIEATLKLFKEKVKSMSIGQTGFFYALDAKEGPNQGNLILHQKKEGEKTLDITAEDGSNFYADMIKQKEGVKKVKWADSFIGETTAQEKLMVFRTMPSSKWLLVGQVNTKELFDEGFNQVLVLAGIALILLAGASYWLMRQIRTTVSFPLKAATEVAQALAVGDLSQRVRATSGDEIGQMLNAINGVGDGLTEVVQQVRHGADLIHQASEEIASGNLDLSQRTERQAGNIEETASSMEELTSTVAQNADNTRDADEFVSRVSKVALEGGAIVTQVVDTMGEIRSSSQKIQDITSVINGIAFQTNILALNAAVEAARAGELGRGFAVVASEVRGLAERAGSAAKDIQTLINDSTDRVEHGNRLAGEAGKTMQIIVDDIQKIESIVREISSASQEQSSGINQVNEAISQMDEMTQQNSALVEQAAAAAESMREQSKRLNVVVAQFKVGDVNSPSKAMLSIHPSASTTPFNTGSHHAKQLRAS